MSKPDIPLHSVSSLSVRRLRVTTTMVGVPGTCQPGRPMTEEARRVRACLVPRCIARCIAGAYSAIEILAQFWNAGVLRGPFLVGLGRVAPSPGDTTSHWQAPSRQDDPVKGEECRLQATTP